MSPLPCFLANAVLWMALVHVAPAAAAPLALQVVDTQGRPLVGAVVGVMLRGQRSVAAGSAAQIVQRERRFDPDVALVQTGTAVQFPNFDTVRHHVYSFSTAKLFELKLYAGTPQAPVVFDKPGVAAIGCNIHDRMAGWVVVMDTPLMARSDAEGRVRLELPAGEHRLVGWHVGMTDAVPFVEQALVMGGAAQQGRLVLPPTR